MQGAQLQTSERSSNDVYNARLLKRSIVLKSVYKDLPIVDLEISLKGVWNQSKIYCKTLPLYFLSPCKM